MRAARSSAIIGSDANCRAFDSLSPESSPSRAFPSMSLASPTAPFCETPLILEMASDTDALQHRRHSNLRRWRRYRDNDLVRRRWRPHPIINKLPNGEHDNNHRRGRDPGTNDRSTSSVARLLFHSSLANHHFSHSESVSIRSAKLKSRSVKPPLLWVERTSRTLL
jgi:hypothetical protein